MVDTLCAVLIEKLQSQKSLRIHSQKIESVASTIQIHISFLYIRKHLHTYIIYTEKAEEKDHVHFFISYMQLNFLFQWDMIMRWGQCSCGTHSSNFCLLLLPIYLDSVYIYEKMIFKSKKTIFLSPKDEPSDVNKTQIDKVLFTDHCR